MKSQVVIEVRGGVIVGVYASDPVLDAHVVDWDDMAARRGSAPSRLTVDPIEAMPTSTRAAIDDASGGQPV